YARVLGGAMTHDGYHVTSIDPDLAEVRRCFREALANAGVVPSQVRYLNAHGPGTRQCDTAEAAVLESMFPAQARVYSIKPLVGHCQGAASAVEVAAAALSYEHGVIPASPVVAPAHPQLLDGLTPMTGGRDLAAALADEPAAWLGAAHVKRYGADPALLVKLLDAGQRLPLHVHPDRRFATAHLASPYGKTEAWVIVDAVPDASVHLGFRRDVAPDELAGWVRDGQVAAMLSATNRVP